MGVSSFFISLFLFFFFVLSGNKNICMVYWADKCAEISIILLGAANFWGKHRIGHILTLTV